MYLIGVVIMLLGLATAWTFKGVPWNALNNPATLVIYFSVVVGVIVATSGFKTFIRGCNALLSRRYELDGEERQKAAHLFRLLSKSILYAALISFLLAIVSSLAYLHDIGMFMHTLATASVSPVVGICLAFVFFEPAAYVLQKTPRKSALVQAYPPHLGDRLLEICIQQGLTPEDIQQATEIILKRE